MRFRELDFLAYGPFTEFRLELTAHPGLHVVYGPNESGKSSALRAVRALLYGMTPGAGDEFLHPGSKLRLRALLERLDGTALDFTRAKGQGKKALVDAQAKVLDPKVLERFLCGVDAALFDRLYGLDHRTLSAGGKALLADGGQVGESLFSAGLGPGFRRVREQLKQEAAEIWTSSSRSRPLDDAMKAFDANRRKADDLSVSAQAWGELQEDIRREEERVSRVSEEMAALESELSRLKRYEQARESVAQRESWLRELSELTATPELDSNFSEKRQRVQATLEAQSLQVERFTFDEKDLRATIGSYPLEFELLPFSMRLGHLHRALDQVLSAQQAIPALRLAIEARESEYARIAHNLGLSLDDAGGVRIPKLEDQSIVRRLVRTYDRIDLEERRAKRELELSRETLARVEVKIKGLGPLLETGILEQRLSRLRGALRLDSEVDSCREALKSRREALDASFESLSRWSASLEELSALDVPSFETLEAMDARFLAIEGERRQLQENLARTKRRGEDVAQKIGALKACGQVGSRFKLEEARHQRDRFWSNFLEADEDRASLQSLFERSLHTVDRLTDELLGDAERVARLQSLNEERDERAQEWRTLREREVGLAAELEKLQRAWAETWGCGALRLGKPSEMQAWLLERDSILRQRRDVARLEARLCEAQANRKSELADIFGELDETSEGLARSEGGGRERLQGAEVGDVAFSIACALARVEAELRPLQERVQEQRRFNGEAKALVEACEQQSLALKYAQEALVVWRKDWAQALMSFPGREKTDPSDLESLLGSYERLRAIEGEKQHLSSELIGHEKVLEMFEVGVRALLEELPKDMLDSDGASSFEIVEEWVMRLAKQERQANELRVLEQQLADTIKSKANVELEMSHSQVLLQGLLSQAGLGVTLEELPQIEAAVDRRQRLKDRIQDAEAYLCGLLVGQDLNEFTAELLAVDWDAVAGQIEALEFRLKTLEEERQLAWQRKGELAQRRSMIDGTSMAAQVAQDAIDVMAEGKNLALRFARLQLAQIVLEREMERYRRENESPILSTANRWFQRLTQQAYQGLVIGLDPQTDKPRLEAVASSGREVTIEGLSDGTRDQLFLALRLAAIEHVLGDVEPMPMVLDDVLVQFDDDRARATLDALVEFSKRTQVLLFSHLKRDAELAETFAPNEVQVLRLEALAM